jgi:uncharacterized protein YaiI (UPF0178 family)
MAAIFTIFIDADGCPVKDEVYKVADRYQLPVSVVANKYLSTPESSRVKMVIAPHDFDGVDDWIVANAARGDVVITADILLAERCVKLGARVLGPKGIEFTEDSIGSAVATRELMQNLRHMGERAGGPAPMEKKDRSRFLGKLDEIIQSLRRSSSSSS